MLALPFLIFTFRQYMYTYYIRVERRCMEVFKIKNFETMVKK